MKVLNLQCQHQHHFEGWFASEDDYQSQRAQDLVSCPMCGDHDISKMLSAPRLNLLSTRSETTAETHADESALSVLPSAVPAVTMPAEMQAAFMQIVKHVMANTEDVGAQFAEEARKMHYGETKERGIRGRVSLDETHALLEEGIHVMPLPLPDALKGPVH